MKLEARAVIAELDAWDESNFRVARAALLQMPEQRDFLFQELRGMCGPRAVARHGLANHYARFAIPNGCLWPSTPLVEVA